MDVALAFHGKATAGLLTARRLLVLSWQGGFWFSHGKVAVGLLMVKVALVLSW